jgi:hypothetical protein
MVTQDRDLALKWLGTPVAILRRERIAFISHIQKDTAMKTTTQQTVVGVFDNPAQAQEAVRELRQAGFTDDQIGVVSQDREGNVEASGTGNQAAEGAAIGAATGLGAGALWGLGIAAGILPGIGPAIAGGTLGILLSSAAAGGAAAGVGGALVGMGIPDEDAEHYESEFRAGRTVVTVQGPRAEESYELLARHGAHSRHV